MVAQIQLQLMLMLMLRSRSHYQCAGCNRPKQSDYEKLPEWATPLLEVLDILTLVTTNSAIVERLWSMYNAIFVGEASASSSSHEGRP